MVSLKSLVSVMSIPLVLSFATPVVAPSLPSGRDRVMLALLGAAPDENHDRIAVLSEVDPVPGPKIDLALEHAAANTLHVREVALSEPVERSRDFRCRLNVESVEPGCPWRASLRIEIFEDADRRHPLR